MSDSHQRRSSSFGLRFNNRLPAKAMLPQLWLIHPDQPEINRLHLTLEGVDSPETVQLVLPDYLHMGA